MVIFGCPGLLRLAGSRAMLPAWNRSRLPARRWTRSESAGLQCTETLGGQIARATSYGSGGAGSLMAVSGASLARGFGAVPFVRQSLDIGPRVPDAQWLPARRFSLCTSAVTEPAPVAAWAAPQNLSQEHKQDHGANVGAAARTRPAPGHGAARRADLPVSGQVVEERRGLIDGASRWPSTAAQSGLATEAKVEEILSGYRGRTPCSRSCWRRSTGRNSSSFQSTPVARRAARRGQRCDRQLVITAEDKKEGPRRCRRSACFCDLAD